MCPGLLWQRVIPSTFYWVKCIKPSTCKLSLKFAPLETNVVLMSFESWLKGCLRSLSATLSVVSRKLIIILRIRLTLVLCFISKPWQMIFPTLVVQVAKTQHSYSIFSKLKVFLAGMAEITLVELKLNFNCPMSN